MPQPELTHITVRIPRDLRRTIAVKAAELDLTKQQLITDALQWYIDQQVEDQKQDQLSA